MWKWVAFLRPPLFTSLFSILQVFGHTIWSMEFISFIWSCEHIWRRQLILAKLMRMLVHSFKFLHSSLDNVRVCWFCEGKWTSIYETYRMRLATIHRKSSNFRRVTKEMFDINSAHVVKVNQIAGHLVFRFESYGNTLKRSPVRSFNFFSNFWRFWYHKKAHILFFS